MRNNIGALQQIYDKVTELNPESAKYINTCLVKEYMNEFQGNRAW
jgi:hypothetical protein